jgi:hypothetical protein
MPLKIQIPKLDTPKAGNPLSSKLDAELTQARATNRSAAYVTICKQDFSRATRHGDETLDFERYL